MPETLDSEVLIIGAGPAGLSAMAECVYHEVGSVRVLEAGPSHNRTVHQYYPDHKRVDAAYKGREAICAGVLCFRDSTKSNFLQTIDHLLDLYPGQIDYNRRVDSIRTLEDGTFLTAAGSGASYLSRYLVIAIGRMGRPNRPDYWTRIPGRVRKLCHFDVHGLAARGRSILVVGGGNSAVEYALSLAGDGGDVTLSYRRARFSRLHPMNRDLLERDERRERLRIHRESDIEAIDEEAGRPLVRFRERPEQPFDHVVFAIGGSSPSGFLAAAGLELDERGDPVLGPGCVSSIPGLYVAGELSVPRGKGSIIASFNSGKHVVEAIMAQTSLDRKPDVVTLHYRDLPPSEPDAEE